MKSLFISAICILILAGCGDNGSKPDNSKKEIFPLAIGNSWTYNHYTYHSSKKDSLKYNKTVTTYITDTINLQGEIWYVMATDGNVSSNIWTNRTDGLYTIYKIRDENDSLKYILDSARIAFKYPVILNETFPDDKNGFFVSNINSNVKVKAGNFKCIKYVPTIYKHLQNMGVDFCPGIGYIRNENITYIDNNQQIPDTTWFVEELVSYTIR